MTTHQMHASGIFTGLLIGALSLPTQATAAPLISQRLIDQQHGYPLKISQLGRFRVTRVYLPNHPNRSCHVDQDSLSKMVRHGFNSGKWDLAQGVKVTVELKAEIANSGDTKKVVCVGPGKDCKAEIEVEEVVAR